jgi:hypothetical protein
MMRSSIIDVHQGCTMLIAELCALAQQVLNGQTANLSSDDAFKL